MRRRAIWVVKRVPSLPLPFPLSLFSGSWVEIVWRRGKGGIWMKVTFASDFFLPFSFSPSFSCRCGIHWQGERTHWEGQGKGQWRPVFSPPFFFFPPPFPPPLSVPLTEEWSNKRQKGGLCYSLESEVRVFLSLLLFFFFFPLFPFLLVFRCGWHGPE